MSDDWQVGDLALCVDDSPPNVCPTEHRPNERVRRGNVYEVTGILPSLNGVTLLLDGQAPYTCDCCIGANGWASTRFRKIRPDEPKACEEEFKILLMLSKKRVSA